MGFVSLSNMIAQSDCRMCIMMKQWYFELAKLPHMAVCFWLFQETLQPFWVVVNLQSSGNAAEFGHLYTYRQVMNNVVILTRNLSTK